MPDDPRPPAHVSPMGDDHPVREAPSTSPVPPKAERADPAGDLFAPVSVPGHPGSPPRSPAAETEPPQPSEDRSVGGDAELAASTDDASFLNVRCALAPEKLRVDYTVHSIQTGVLACIAVVVGLVRFFTTSDLTVLALQGGGAVALLAAYKLGTDAFSRASYRRASYRVSSDGLEIRRGVVWRTVTTIPSSRVQHTDVSRGPLERMFRIATLAIHTAGTSNATVLLPGLPSARALRIRDYLLEARDAFDAV